MYSFHWHESPLHLWTIMGFLSKRNYLDWNPPNKLSIHRWGGWVILFFTFNVWSEMYWTLFLLDGPEICATYFREEHYCVRILSLRYILWKPWIFVPKCCANPCVTHTICKVTFLLISFVFDTMYLFYFGIHNLTVAVRRVFLPSAGVLNCTKFI